MIDVDELSEEEIEAVLNTRMFQKAMAYRRLAAGIEVLEDEDQVFQSLVNTITKQHTQVRSEDSVREFFELFRQEVETFTEQLAEEDDTGTTADLRKDVLTSQGVDDG